jgi:hypothetical protein
MNERINELAEQATEYVQHGFTTQETYFNKEKFAELIVKECLNATRGAVTGLDAFNSIKQHFGVEE